MIGIVCICLGAALMWFGGQFATDGWKEWRSAVEPSEPLNGKNVPHKEYEDQNHNVETERSSDHYMIDPLLSGHFTAVDLLSSTATIEFVTDVKTIQLEKTIFAVHYGDFSFSLNFRNGTIVLNRCDNLINHRIRSTNPTEKIKIKIVYEPHKMGLLVGDNILFAELAELSSQQEKDEFLMSQYFSAAFPPVYPPNSMLRWVRKQKLIPMNEYNSFGELSDSVASMIVSIESKIKNSNMYSAFWDRNKEQSLQTPKKETEIHGILLGLIQDECLLKSLDINHEGTAGSGNLDFYISGFVRNSGINGVCLEVKHAHSRKLKKGLTHQLPSYMRTKGADFGIYLVLWFKGKNFDSPVYQTYHLMEDDLHKYRNEIGLGKMIRIITFDLSGIASPSIL